MKLNVGALAGFAFSILIWALVIYAGWWLLAKFF